jgi:hypothetical protein
VKPVHTKTFFVSTLTLFTLSLLALTPAVAQSQIIAWSPQLHFLLPATKTTVSFSNTAYFSAFEWDNFNASSIKFYNFQVSGDEAPLPVFGIAVYNANATVDYINQKGMGHITLYAPSGITSTLIIYYSGSYPPAVDVGQETVKDSNYFRSYNDWRLHPPPAVYLNETMKTLYIKTWHSSPVAVTVYWAAAPAGGGGGGGGQTQTYIPTFTPPPAAPTPTTAPESIVYAVIAVSAVLLIVAVSKELEVGAKNVSKKWRKIASPSKKDKVSKKWEKQKKR